MEVGLGGGGPLDAEIPPEEEADRGLVSSSLGSCAEVESSITSLIGGVLSTLDCSGRGAGDLDLALECVTLACRFSNLDRSDEIEAIGCASTVSSVGSGIMKCPSDGGRVERR